MKKKKRTAGPAPAKGPDAPLPPPRRNARQSDPPEQDRQVRGSLPADAGSWLPIGMCVLAFAAPLVFDPTAYKLSYIPKAALIQIGAFFLAFAFIGSAFLRGSLTIRLPRIGLPLLAFIAWSVLSLFWTHNRLEAQSTLFHWTACTVWFFLVAGAVATDGDRRRLLGAVFASGAVCAVLGIAQALFGWEGIPQAVPPAATFANKNLAVHFVALSLPLGAGLLMTGRSRLWNAAVVLAMALMTVYLFYTRSRGAYLLLLVEPAAFAAFLLIGRKRLGATVFWNKEKWLLCAVGCVLVVSMAAVGQEGISGAISEIKVRSQADLSQGLSIAEAGGATGSIGWRIGTWKNTVHMALDRPVLGWGLGNFKVFYPAYHRKSVVMKTFSYVHQPLQVHNDPLQVFTELGVVGLALLLGLFAVLVRTAMRAASGADTAEKRALSIGMGVGIVALAVNTLYDFPLQSTIPPFVALSYAGILGAVAAPEEGGSIRLRTHRRSILAAASVCMLIAFFAITVSNYHRIRNDRIYFTLTGLDHPDYRGDILRQGQKAQGANIEKLKILGWMGRTYLQMGMNSAAVEAIAPVLAAYPNDLPNLFHMATGLDKLGRQEEAVETLERAVRIWPPFYRAHVKLANIYSESGQWEKALAAFENAAGANPKKEKLYFDIGLTAVRANEYERAAEAFQTVLKNASPWSAMAHMNLGIVYFQFLNREEEGIDHLKQALQLDPGIENAPQFRVLIRQWEMQHQDPMP